MPAPATPPADAPAGRLTREQQAVLRHPVRRQAYAVVEAAPGVAVTDLGAMLGLSWGTLAFHLRVLSRVGLVEFRAHEGRRRVHPATAGARRVEDPAAALLQDPGTRALAAALVRDPGQRLSEAAAALDGSACAAHHHLRRLRRMGLVKPGAAGATSLTPTDELARLLP